MSGKIQAIRGMHDILPEETPRWQHLEALTRSLLDTYGYQEIRLPIVEKTELFQRSIGELTDIVAKEMYSFEDRNGDSLTLRPEGTAGCVRAGLEHGLLYNQIRKLWYMGPMFRHERPQKGRQRQFHQIGVEAFGLPGPDIDAEMILMCARLWQHLGLANLRLEINSLGTPESRVAYRKVLVDYFSAHQDQLDKDSLTRLENNPLRILDSKNPDMRPLIDGAPEFSGYIDNESVEHFQTLCEYLDRQQLNYVINPRLVRGLDYYGRTVFEWITDDLGAQGTVCAGGRYDGLVEHFAGQPTPAIGFAMGLERLIGLMESSTNRLPDSDPHAYLIIAGDEFMAAGLALAESLREQLPWLRLVTHLGGGSLKNQFKKADKSGARLALVLGADEAASQEVSIKSLRDQAEQERISRNSLADHLAARLQAV